MSDGMACHLGVRFGSSVVCGRRTFFETSNEDWHFFLNQQLTASWYLAKTFVWMLKDRKVAVASVDAASLVAVTARYAWSDQGRRHTLWGSHGGQCKTLSACCACQPTFRLS